MSADLDNQPYDNVEFPVRKPPPGTGGYPGMSAAQRGNLVTGGGGVSGRDVKGYGTLAPVVEGGGVEEEEEEEEGEMLMIEDQRQRAGVVQGVDSSTVASTPVSNTVVTTPPRAATANKTGNHVTPTSKPSQLQTPTEHKPANRYKPPPSPSRDSKSSFIIDQPKCMDDFTWGAFNPMSQEVFETAYTRHKYFYKFSDRVLKQGSKMKTNVWDVPGKPGESMTYEQLLQGVLVEGERLLLGGGWLYFRDVQFYEPECTKQIKPPIGEGRICLTNLRLMIMCAEVSADAQLSEFGSPPPDGAPGGPGGYKLTVSKLNNVYMQNIPIDCFESVELSSTVGTVAESKLTEAKPCCCGLFSCIGLGSCDYTWRATPALPMNIARRVIRLGVYMPPWRTPSIMIVNLHPKLSLPAARDFVTQLQNHVPQMQYHRQNSTVL